MDEKLKEDLSYDKAIGDILGIINCLLVIADVEALKRWFYKNHSEEILYDHLPGYKLVFNTLFRMLISEIERNSSLGLTSDDTFNRATFRGISINKLPNTCEKAILIRNLQNYFKDIIDANKWESINTAMQRLSVEVLTPFNNIKQISSLNKNYPICALDTAINYSSMFQVYIFLNDTSKGIPHGYLPAMIDDQEAGFGFQYLAAQKLSNAFVGYKYTVQFLWHQLLKDNYIDSVVRDIHKTNNWNSFDKYFDKIKCEIITPLEKDTGGLMGYDHFILIESNPKVYLRKLLENEIPELLLSKEDKFQRHFLWYPIQLIDGSEYSFSGAPAFISILMGIIQMKRRSREKSKAKVVRIIHGGVENHRRSYSYSILIEISGYISDSSGWLLFYDCCDDRGSTSGLFREIESLLERYNQKGFIEITSICIDKETLLKFVGDVPRENYF